MLVGLFMFSIILSAGVVSAAWTQDVAGWVDRNVFEGLKDQGFVKVLILFLIIGVIFSALGFMGIPDNSAIRFLLSVVVGTLVTSLISPSEIVAAMQSSKALGITIILGFPIMIMCAITLQIALKGHFMGVMVQRFLWLIYSLYLFLTSAGTWLYSNFSSSNILNFLGYLDFVNADLIGGNKLIVIIQLILSIVLFWFMFVKNQAVVDWIKNQKFFDDISKMKDTFRRDTARTKESAAQTEQ